MSDRVIAYLATPIRSDDLTALLADAPEGRYLRVEDDAAVIVADDGEPS